MKKIFIIFFIFVVSLSFIARGSWVDATTSSLYKGVAINKFTGECAGFLGGRDRFIFYSLPVGWEGFYPNEERDYWEVKTKFGGCRFTKDEDETYPRFFFEDTPWQECITSLGLTWANFNEFNLPKKLDINELKKLNPDSDTVKILESFPKEYIPEDFLQCSGDEGGGFKSFVIDESKRIAAKVYCSGFVIPQFGYAEVKLSENIKYYAIGQYPNEMIVTPIGVCKFMPTKSGSEWLQEDESCCKELGLKFVSTNISIGKKESIFNWGTIKSTIKSIKDNIENWYIIVTWVFLPIIVAVVIVGAIVGVVFLIKFIFRKIKKTKSEKDESTKEN